jgi:hypothetical protein
MRREDDASDGASFNGKIEDNWESSAFEARVFARGGNRRNMPLVPALKKKTG